jgi:hypothetical protein
MHRQIKCIIIALLIGLTPIVLTGQIIAPTADLLKSTTYPTGSNDPIFVFNENNPERYIAVDTTYSGYSIQWEEYIPGTGFQNLATTSDTLHNILQSGTNEGYRLTLTNIDTTIIAISWTVLNSHTIEILTIDSEGNITRDALTSRDCIWIGYIEVDYIYEPLIYYDPATDNMHVLRLNYSSDYSTNPIIDEGYGIMYEVDSLNGVLRFAIDESWWKDAVYTIKIIDEAGYRDSADINVTAIRPKADFDKPELVHLDDEETYPDRSDYYYEAYDEDYNDSYNSGPAIFEFTNKSFNADSMTWSFGDSTHLVVTADTGWVRHTYLAYGTYYPQLSVVKYFDFRRECYDATDANDDALMVEVDIPELDAGNVFSPPNGKYPVWRFHDVSITDFELAIYNRYGKRVHYFEGNIRDWDGWDGTNKSTSNYASTGVYYYVLKNFSTIPYFNGEKPVYEPIVYSGYIHLFNTE